MVQHGESVEIPEILLKDEWITAGRVSFLAKAQRRVQSFAEKASIMVPPSPSIATCCQFCKQGSGWTRARSRQQARLMKYSMLSPPRQTSPSRRGAMATAARLFRYGP